MWKIVVVLLLTALAILGVPTIRRWSTRISAARRLEPKLLCRRR
jgi:hypothetical protein